MVLSTIDVAECRLALDQAGKKDLSVVQRLYNFTDIPLLHIIDRDGNSLTSYFWYEDEPQGWLCPEDSQKVSIAIGAKSGRVTLVLPPGVTPLPRPVDAVRHWLNETTAAPAPSRKENKAMKVLRGAATVVRVTSILCTWGWGIAAIVFGIKLALGSASMETAVGVAIVAMVLFGFEIWGQCNGREN